MATTRDYQRALLVIEGMCLESSSDYLSPDGAIPLGWKPEAYIAHLQRIVGDCYAIAHAGSGKCCKGGLGSPFWVIMEDRELFLKDAGIADVQAILDRTEEPCTTK